MDRTIEHSDVTTIMRLLADIQSDVRKIGTSWRTRMGKEQHLKMTPEEHAQRDETQRLARERIAEREAKEREEDERRAGERGE